MRTVAVLVLVVVFAGGCAAPPSKFVRPKFDVTQFKKIAVLPIDNFSTDKLAGEKVRLALIVELLSKGLDVIEPGEVNSALVNLNIINLRTLSSDKLKAVGKELGADLLMVGTITEYGMERGNRGQFPQISLNILMIEASTGRAVTSVWNSTDGPSIWTNYFGAEGESLTGATRKVVADAVRSCF